MRKRVAEACRDGIDATMGACVTEAKRNVPVRTATLQGSIRFDPAEIKGSEVSGVWGSFDVNYALAVETGNRSLVGPPGSSSWERGPSRGPGRNTGNTGFLRGAADQEYPKLARRINRELSK